MEIFWGGFAKGPVLRDLYASGYESNGALLISKLHL